MIEDLTYEQTIQLEKNIGIKNKANELYSDFIKYFTLNVSDYDESTGMFRVWSDSHNATFIEIKEKVFHYRARFLHESYDVIISPSHLFEYIKDQYRGVEHFESLVKVRKARMIRNEPN